MNHTALPTTHHLQAATAPHLAPHLAPACHHFAGTLLEAAHACTGDLWQISLRFVDEAGRSQYVYMAPGRGEAGALACGLQLAALTIGQRYHGHATMHRAGESHDYYAGRVALATDQRRPAPHLAARNATVGADAA